MILYAMIITRKYRCKVHKHSSNIMTTDSDRNDIVSAFGPSDTLTDAVIEKLTTFKQIFNLSTDDIYVNWESFNVTKVQTDLDLTVENLDKFQEYLQEIISKSTPSVKREKNITSSRKPLANNNFNASSPIPSTPSLKKRKVTDDGTTPYKTPATKFDSSPSYETANSTFQSSSPTKRTSHKPDLSSMPNLQQESCTVLETLNPHIDEVEGVSDTKPFKLMSNFENSKYKFRNMSMKLLESADVLDDQIDSFAQLYQETNLTKDTQFGNPCLSSQFDIICCGRIVPDSTSYDHFHQLNSSSLFLETSRMSGIGQRIPLDISQLVLYSFFPGQIVLLKGRNPTGSTFIVQEVLEAPQIGAPVTPKDELLEYEELTQGNGLKLLVASGPYSNVNTLNFTKFEKFIENINSDIKPHVVILNGPFIDITNDAISKGDIEVPENKPQPKTLDELFKNVFSPILKTIDSRIQVILIPTVKDTSVKSCSYPQDAFERKKFGLPKNVKIFPNPSSFSLNEILIGNSNLDIYKDLIEVSKQDLNNSKNFNNRLERITNHIFDQRRYYPVFPGSLKRRVPSEALEQLTGGYLGKEVSEAGIGGSTLEVPYLGLTELGTSLPDILIIPSELKFFAKVVKGVLVINPGHFIRSNRDPTREDGSYVVTCIQSPSVTEPNDNNVEAVDQTQDLYYHNVYKRSRVDIFKS